MGEDSWGGTLFIVNAPAWQASFCLLHGDLPCQTREIAFSRDAAQKYIYLADGTNEVVRVVLRESLQELTNFGDGGRQPGQFYGVHSIATDSKGNIYTTETYEGKRLQKFVLKGMARVAPARLRDL